MWSVDSGGVRGLVSGGLNVVLSASAGVICDEGDINEILSFGLDVDVLAFGLGVAAGDAPSLSCRARESRLTRAWTTFFHCLPRGTYAGP